MLNVQTPALIGTTVMVKVADAPHVVAVYVVGFGNAAAVHRPYRAAAPADAPDDAPPVIMWRPDCLPEYRLCLAVVAIDGPDHGAVFIVPVADVLVSLQVAPPAPPPGGSRLVLPQ